MAVTKSDEYSNMYQVTLTESAAGTLTFTEINLGLTLFQKKAILISRIVIDWGYTLVQAMVAAADTAIVGLCQSNQLSTIALSDSATIWKAQKGLVVYGTPANAKIEEVVDVYDLSTIPGGGEFLVPTPLYGAIQCGSIAAAQSVTMRMYFQVIDLKEGEYIELLESRHFFG
jgi:hypothetical protein